jgi:hypothetical protein
MFRILTLLLFLNLPSSTDLIAQRELAVADYEMLADSLLADYHVELMISSISTRYQSAFKKKVADYSRIVTGCGTSTEYIQREYEKLKLSAEKQEAVLLNLETITKEYAYELAQQIASSYSSLSGGPTVITNEHLLYFDEGTQDLTEWLIAYSRKEESVREMMDFEKLLKEQLDLLDQYR